MCLIFCLSNLKKIHPFKEKAVGVVSVKQSREVIIFTSSIMDPNKTPVSRIQKRFCRKSNRSYYTPIGKENWDPDFVNYPGGGRRNKNDESPESFNASPSVSEERQLNEFTSTMERNCKNPAASKHDIRMTNSNTRTIAMRGAVKLMPSFSVWNEDECICRD